MFSLKKSEEILYNKIIFLSRNKLLYEEFGLKDTFIGASLDYIFLLLFILLPIKIYTKFSDRN